MFWLIPQAADLSLTGNSVQIPLTEIYSISARPPLQYSSPAAVPTDSLANPVAVYSSSLAAPGSVYTEATATPPPSIVHSAVFAASTSPHQEPSPHLQTVYSLNNSPAPPPPLSLPVYSGASTVPPPPPLAQHQHHFHETFYSNQAINEVTNATL